ncbi:cytidine deaminase [Pokkaliibacter plantistimulans]|uniref:Cytidine deaminase n=1 Tax=Pokkaliibacter plantistimulans TaxID=1635171 RepID=A0ABX5LYM2_9GAMM|nr:cytidine deaminase [Pokkaliibacter plantistimulans]PXF30396.1 cytidine deaminase [Pokkaliibacter plantistimulans]
MKPSTDPQLLAQMKAVAKAAASRAYIPYSHFPVGAALLLADGQIVPGCNVENISYGLGNCAERTAIFSAIAQGHAHAEFVSMLIYMPGDTLYSPCGACRQVMVEFFPEEREVIATCDSDAIQVWTMAELLPASFSSFTAP